MALTGANKRVLVVGDRLGVQQLLRALPSSAPVGIVAASNRPQYHDELARLAEAHSLPLLVQPPAGSDGYAGFRDEVEALHPDLILCNSYSMILRDDLLSLARAGAANIHPGKLPEFRGPNPIQWAIIEGERETAVTMHEMTSEVDAGAIIGERRVPIRFTDTWRDVSTRLQTTAEELLATELPRVLDGSGSRTPQDESAAASRPRRRPEDGRIDWTSSVATIYDLIRALGDGIPPAFYEHAGSRVELERLSLGEVAALAFAPGPGGREFVLGGVRLVPTAGELVDFRVLRTSGAAGVARLEPVDLDARKARLRLEPEDAEAAALIQDFAREELGFTIVD